MGDCRTCKFAEIGYTLSDGSKIWNTYCPDSGGCIENNYRDYKRRVIKK